MARSSGTAQTVAIVIIVLVFVFMAGIIAYIMVRSPGTQTLTGDEGPTFVPPITPPPPIKFMYQCSEERPCEEGLVCDVNTSTCLVPVGGRCTLASDCLTGLYCSGYCYDKEETPPNLITYPAALQESIGAPCPCYNPLFTGLECVSSNALDRDPNARACYLGAGQVCSLNSQCSSGSCLDGICQQGIPLGGPCNTDFQCLSGNCSLGVCQPFGVVTGDENSVCTDITQCNSGLVCSLNGTCQVPSSGLTLNCGGIVSCPGTMGCYKLPSQDVNGNYPSPGSAEGFGLCTEDQISVCACLYNTDVNTAVPLPNRGINNQCSPGYTLNQNGDCVGQIGEPCVRGNNCASGLCTGLSAVYAYTPILIDDVCYPLTGISGVVSSEWQALASIDSVEKLTGVTLGYSPPIIDPDTGEIDCSTINYGTEVLYAVTPTGVYDYNFGTSRWDLVLGATININGVSSQLIDAEVTTLNGEELLLVGYTNPSTGAVLYSYSGGILTPYNGSPQIDFTSISAVDLNGVAILLGTSAGQLYFKGPTSSSYTNVTSYLPVGATSPKLAYGSDINDNVYLVISYIRPVIGGFSNLSFSRSLTTSDTQSENLTLPSGLFGAPIGSSIVQNFSLSNANPQETLVLNGVVVASVGTGTDSLFYVNFLNSSMTALPGYVGSNSSVEITTRNVYLYSSNSCS